MREKCLTNLLFAVMSHRGCLTGWHCLPAGELPKQEAATLLSHAPPILLEQALNCMDLSLREALSEAVDSLAHSAPQRRSSFRS